MRRKVIRPCTWRTDLHGGLVFGCGGEDDAPVARESVEDVDGRSRLGSSGPEARREHASPEASRKAAIECAEQRSSRNGRKKISQFAEADTGIRDAMNVPVVGNQIVILAAVPRECDHHDVLGNGVGRECHQGATYRRSRRSLVSQQHRTGAEGISEQGVEGLGVTHCSAQPLNIGVSVAIYADMQAAEHSSHSLL